MKIDFIVTMVLGLATLFVYTLVERRINQRPCLGCGFRVSVDNPDELCPQCGRIITSGQESDR